MPIKKNWNRTVGRVIASHHQESTGARSTLSRRIRSVLLLGAVGLAIAPLSGCVVFEIRDNLIAANESMAEINASIQETRQEMESIKEVNRSLGELVRDRMELVESIDGTMMTVDKDLDAILASLNSLDRHLASLRRTLSNIDSTIPFLKIVDDSPIEETDSIETTPEGADPESAQPVGDAQNAEEAVIDKIEREEAADPEP